MTGRVIGLFAGPGGVDMGARILGIEGIDGYDIDVDACATARAAGFHRVQADVRSLDLDAFEDVTTAVVTSPCPTVSVAGKGTGRKGTDRETILDGISAFGAPGWEDEPAEYREASEKMEDQRTALLLENIRWAICLPNITTLVCENVPGSREYWWEIAAVLVGGADWKSVHVIEVHAEDLGIASNRKRAFLVACRDRVPDLDGLPLRAGIHVPRFDGVPHPLMPVPPVPVETTMADALGWPAGESVNTRGNRRTSGGNEFPADRPAWCVTGKARSWRRISDGAELTTSQGGQLVGFPAAYPWRGPSRTSIFQQIADVVSPPVAAAVLGVALGVEWQQPVRDYLTGIYPRSTPRSYQPSLFEEVA